MTYAMKPLSCDPGRIRGMSERISHYENNYGGAVKRLNFSRRNLPASTLIPTALRVADSETRSPPNPVAGSDCAPNG